MQPAEPGLVCGEPEGAAPVGLTKVEPREVEEETQRVQLVIHA